MRFGPNQLEEIVRRTDIVQLVARRVKLTRKGRAMWGCCPFHGEKTPSFKVDNERRAYKCFGCGVGGDAFKWLMQTEGLSFPEAVERLAAEAGVELPKWSAQDEERAQKKKSLFEIVEAGCAFFQEQLHGSRGAKARDYLLTRGLTGDAVKKFRLGYAPAGNATLIEHLKTKNITVDDMVAAGLARPSQDNRAVRDFFFDRLMFAITDARGRVVGFGGRSLSEEIKPKYINTGETSLFSKGQLLYNFAPARPAAIKAQTILVCEGYMDVIALVQAGFDYAVAPLGTALTEDQLHLLWRTAPEPVLAFDGDDAGVRAAHRAAHLALPHLRAGHSLRFAFLPSGEDPDSFLKANGTTQMKGIIETALPLSEVLWRMQTADKDLSTPERRAGLERALAEIVSAIADAKVADYYRRDFDQRVYDAFKRRITPNRGRKDDDRYNRRGSSDLSRRAQIVESVSPAVKASTLARSGQSGVIKVKEGEIAALLWADPDIALRHGELLAQLPIGDRELDRLRHLLLNVAASGSRLEKTGLENQLIRLGMADLLARLKAWVGGGGLADGTSVSPDAKDFDARFLKAASDLREMAERAPERARAMERFKAEGTEENWREAKRLLGTQSNE